ncbi:MAG TPA: symmetrical bis(5'-nucleosyl)-tetraphosphatase [Pseudomonadales bacterium]|nr:symmetrical bis(5'-nucleosyl)-tetraphosphatase [Pseudomonadales bacterium]
MATYVVGDLQGCLDPLRELLDQVHFDPAIDQLWLTGDLVNRGPASLACLRFVKNLGASAVTVLGNHDLHLLAIARAGLAHKRKDTLDDILNAPDRDALLDWLRQQPLMFVDDTKKVALVHAGIFPGWTLAQAQQCAREVEAVLQSGRCVEFLRAMYGDEPDNWSDGLKDVDRWRFITNAFTRMRICATEKKHVNALQLRYKEDVENIPKGYVPWFTRFQPPPGWRILFGHWAALLAETGVDNIIALDSGCVWGRFLTLLRLDDGAQFFSSAGKK